MNTQIHNKAIDFTLEASRVIEEFPTHVENFLASLPSTTFEELKAQFKSAELFGPMYLPGVSVIDCTLSPGIGFMLKLETHDNLRFYPTIVVDKNSAGKSNYTLLCGNHTLTQGTLPAHAASGMPLDWDFPVGMNPELQKQFKAKTENALKSTIPDITNGIKASNCNYRILAASGTPKLCNHLQYLMYKVAEQLEVPTSDIAEAMLKQLENAIAEKLSESKDLTEKSPLEISLERYAFKYPILVEGSQGAGKTLGARTFAAKSGFEVVEMAGHEGMTTDEMCGYNFISGSKEIWIDGQLSKACRIAAKGHKVVLIADELLRIPSRQLSIFLTLLSPFEGFYYFNTGRIMGIEDGVASMEVLKIPVQNITVIATTNVGPNFEVDDMDPALRERFYIVRQDSSRDFVEAVCRSVAQKQGYDLSIVAKLLTFYDSMIRAKQSAKVNDTPSVRILINALTLHNSETEVQNYLANSYLQWVARDMDGYPNSEQKIMVEAAVNNAFTGE